jgi:hypothetical protein
MKNSTDLRQQLFESLVARKLVALEGLNHPNLRNLILSHRKH